ncbi:MAG: hypothetical protein ACSLFH_01335 [Desulfuromonadales bacterium]
MAEKIVVKPDLIDGMGHLSYCATERALDGIERTEGDRYVHAVPLQSKRNIGDLPGG